MHEPETVTADNEADAIATAIDEHLPADADTWVRIPDHFIFTPNGLDALWQDDRTVAAWNVTGPRGTYQTRLARPTQETP
jgi:hypothetical protein